MFYRLTSRHLQFLLLIVMAVGAEIRAEDPVDYLTKIKPILRDRCYACHGALKQEGQLRLDTALLAIKGGESGAAITPHGVEASLLLQRISASDESQRMPPRDEGEPLTAEQISLITRWIQDGAQSPVDEEPETDPRQHWAFQPIIRPEVPNVESAWIRNPIDAFIAERLRHESLVHRPEAARIELLRRLHFDLIGVPPTLEEIEACEKDVSDDWYENVAQKLLNDPRHGERWARHWMDVWRYSDWWGLGDQLRNSQKHIWHWRDWIIESLNRDTGYDEMIRLMLAADELHPNDLEKLRATGYLARNYWLFNRPQWMEETVEHVSKGFLGLTMNCTRCHDHKYDPFQQADYYRMRAFFEPYHVRLDVVPGETDLGRDGIPRAFDGLPDEPTYLYIRGDERNPDKTQVIGPGVPSVFSFREIQIQPVALPSEAWQPERRPWVADAYISAAKTRLASAQDSVAKAQQGITKSEADLQKFLAKAEVAHEDSQNVLLTDDFDSLDLSRWQLFGGNWVHESGQLLQKMDGAQRSVMRMKADAPRDFEATIRFRILGGSQWRSVGIAFDSTQGDPSQTPQPADCEQTVYLSAVEGGSKLQAAYQRNGEWTFPGGNAVHAMPVQLNELYPIKIEVRDTLVNASLNGVPLIAWQTEFPRQNGSLQITTFDALTAIDFVSVSRLDPQAVLLTAETLQKNVPVTVEMARAAVEIARGELRLSEAALALAQADLTSIQLRAEAQQLHSDVSAESSTATVAAAIKSERLLEVARANHKIAEAELGVLRASADKRAEAEKTLNDARTSLSNSMAAVDAEIKPTDSFTRFTGALWTPTRFMSSLKDDPEVRFQPQSTGRRTALAQWITDRRNPLTARVAVNHIWMRHMGQPLVPTVFDFGRKGTPPYQPELLDWLASELMDSGWSMKHIHKLITNSSTYRQSSSLAGADEEMKRDPENHLLWRRVPIRLESQVIRDSLLALAGTLDYTLGGPPVPLADQAGSNRRSLYFFHSNNERNLFLTTFDEALVKDCYRREQSIVPQQALALTNSELAIDSAAKIAERLSSGSVDNETFVRNAFRLVVGINPDPQAVAASLRAMEMWKDLPDGDETKAKANLVWVLINHNDFVTLR